MEQKNLLRNLESELLNRISTEQELALETPLRKALNEQTAHTRMRIMAIRFLNKAIHVHITSQIQVVT